ASRRRPVRLRLEEVKSLVRVDDRIATGAGGSGRQASRAIERAALEGQLRIFATVKATWSGDRGVHEHDRARRCVNREGYPGLKRRWQGVVAADRSAPRAGRQQDTDEPAKRNTHARMTSETRKDSTPSRAWSRGRGRPRCLILKPMGCSTESP